MTREQRGEQRTLTEAEFHGWAEDYTSEIADELTAALPQALQDAGLHIEVEYAQDASQNAPDATATQPPAPDAPSAAAAATAPHRR